jgi:amino acid transporter
VFTGRSSLDSAPFDPGSSTGGWPGIGLALSFGVLAIVGYEEAATFGEEAKDSRRTVSRGLWMAGISMPIFFLFVAYVLVTSYGPIAEFADDPLAAQTVAGRVWGDFDAVIAVVVIMSTLAYAQTAFNAGIRVVYSLGRVKVLPAVFVRTHRRYKTPTAALVLFSAVAVPTAFIGAALAGPLDLYGYFGFMTAVAFLVMYAITNVALIRYILRHDPGAFSVVRHLVVPLVGMAGVLYPLYRTVYPLAASPYPLLTGLVAVWAAIGVVVLLCVRATRSVDVAQVARAFAAVDEPAPPVQPDASRA